MRLINFGDFWEEEDLLREGDGGNGGLVGVRGARGRAISPIVHWCRGLENPTFSPHHVPTPALRGSTSRNKSQISLPRIFHARARRNWFFALFLPRAHSSGAKGKKGTEV